MYVCVCVTCVSLSVCLCVFVIIKLRHYATTPPRQAPDATAWNGHDDQLVDATAPDADAVLPKHNYTSTAPRSACNSMPPMHVYVVHWSRF